METIQATLSKDASSNISWLDFVSKPDEETRAALKSNGWRWSSYRQQWYNNRRWPVVPKGIEVEDGGEVAYAVERADRLTERAQEAHERSEQAYNRSNAIVSMIPLGQPILVGHHSEKRHRRDLDRMGRAMDTSVAESRKGQRLEQAAASSAAHQARKERPDVVARRIERLQKERIAFLNQRKPWNEFTGRDLKAEPVISERDQPKLDWYNEQIATNEQLLADLGGLPADRLNIKPGDVVMCGGYKVRVNKLSKKTFRGDILERPYLGDYLSSNRQFSMTEVTKVVERAA